MAVIIRAMDKGEDEGRAGQDDELVARARTGDAAAVEELFDRYRHQVFSLAYRMTGNPADAEDLTQDVFVQVMRKIGSFQGRSSFSTWLYRVTMNRSRDFLRRKKRSPEMLSTDGEPGDYLMEDRVGTVQRAPEDNAIASEAQRLVQEALQQLPVSLRAPLVLHELEGFEYHEIARMLVLPVGTVKSRIFRARLKLGEILEPHKEQWS
ncbi:MAG: sigma-70 family RNA polymerase sigma factor [Actinobacteria bacterium]|nr:sigma-70 family RNA polymerase sigma factor [Actinomycetota bacterium]